MTDWMITVPRRTKYDRFNKIMLLIHDRDIHKWIIGAETGSGGYDHWQIRMKTRCDDNQLGFAEERAWWTAYGFPEAHIEPCSDKYTYEAKEGNYLASWDTMERRAMRFGKMRWYQERILEDVLETDDRQVMVWVDPNGDSGKSWLCGHLVEKGIAYYVPPIIKDAEGMMKWLCDLVKQDVDKGNPPRPLVIIDIPRTWKWKTEHYVTIEAIKDGLLFDPRYGSTLINIRGCKLLVMCNEKPKLDRLSEDRWKFAYSPGIHW